MWAAWTEAPLRVSQAPQTEQSGDLCCCHRIPKDNTLYSTRMGPVTENDTRGNRKNNASHPHTFTRPITAAINLSGQIINER